MGMPASYRTVGSRVVVGGVLVKLDRRLQSSQYTETLEPPRGAFLKQEFNVGHSRVPKTLRYSFSLKAFR